MTNFFLKEMFSLFSVRDITLKMRDITPIRLVKKD